jgi:hypothetical protein
MEKVKKKVRTLEKINENKKWAWQLQNYIRMQMVNFGAFENVLYMCCMLTEYYWMSFFSRNLLYWILDLHIIFLCYLIVPGVIICYWRILHALYWVWKLNMNASFQNERDVNLALGLSSNHLIKKFPYLLLNSQHSIAWFRSWFVPFA